MAKRTNSPQVDEDFMKEIIAQGFPKKRETEILASISDEQQPELLHDKPKKRKNINQEYVEQYFQKVDFSDRQLIYITRDTHRKLTDIVNVIGGKHGTLSGYIENIVCEHFETHKEEINTLYSSKFKKPL